MDQDHDEKFTDDHVTNDNVIDDHKPHNNTLNWAINPKWVNDHMIVFTSNRDVFPEEYASSIWSINIETEEIKKIIDATITNDELHVIYSDSVNLIVWGGITHTLIHYSFVDASVKSFGINGVPFNVSNNGEIVLYNALDKTSTLLPVISALNIHSGEITNVEHLNDHQVYSGSWSKDNNLFAFYSRSYKDFSAQVFIYNHINQSINEIQVPKDKGLIDSHSSISWLNDNQIIISSEQGSWTITVRGVY